MHSDLIIARSLTWRYVVALLLVATLATAAWISIYLVISEQQSTAAIVNISGRQRMLSQRTALFASLLVSAPQEERPSLRTQLTQAADLMKKSHQGLTQGNVEMGLPATMSPTVRAMYFEKPLAVHAQVEHYLANLQSLLQIPDDQLRPDNLVLREIIMTAPSGLVSALDKMVAQYQLEGEAAILRLHRAETVVWILTLILLLLEATLIFRPFARQMQWMVSKLQTATDGLQRSNEELENRVRQRTADLEQKTKQLADSEERFRLISTSAKDAILIIDHKGLITYWNPAATEMFGHAAQEAIGNDLHDLIAPPRFLPTIRQGLQHFVETGDGPLIGKTVEVLALRRGGVEFPIELSIAKLELGGHPCAVGIIRDISDRKKTEESLRLAASVFANSYDGVVITDAHSVVVDVNPAFSRITSYGRDEIVGKTPKVLASGRHAPQFYLEMWDSLKARDFWQGEIWNRRKTGEIYAERLTISAVRDDDGNLKHYIGVFTDISHIKEHEAELERIAHYDTLTGVPNRRLFTDRLNQAVAQSKRHGGSMALCYLDLDGFKPINDQYGHAVGDAVLVETANRLKLTLRNEDTLARLGGDEFAIILGYLVEPGELHMVLDRILTAIETPIRIGATAVGVSASIGVTLYPDDDADPETLLRHADQAMYSAKDSGRNRFQLFDPAAFPASSSAKPGQTNLNDSPLPPLGTAWD